MTPAETAIRDAMLAVEAAGADVRLTRAIVLLGEAREQVADFVDAAMIEKGIVSVPTRNAKRRIIVFIVNGEDVAVEIQDWQPLQLGRDCALRKSHNTGRPPHEWEIRSNEGFLLEPATKASTVANGASLYLTLRTASGGTG